MSPSVIVILLLSSVPSLLANMLGVGRPLISVDYFIPLLLFGVGRRWLGTITLGIVIVADIYLLATQILPFNRFSDFLYFLTIFDVIPFRYRVFIILSILALFLLLWTMGFLLKQPSRLVSLLIFNIAIGLYGYGIYFYERSDDNRFYRVDDTFWIDSPLIYLFEYRTGGFTATANYKTLEFAPTKSSRLFCSTVGCEPQKRELSYLFILNESWGVYQDPMINLELTKSIREEYPDKVNYGSFLFSGATVEAELKELCGLSVNSYNLRLAEQKDLEGCLPHQLKSEGYNTYAYHGASGFMYHRHYWYPLLGFDEIVFGDTHSWPQRCHSFPGACDVDIADEIVSNILSDNQSFHYWLTLNTHHNYNLKDLQIDTPSCDDFNIERGEVCRNTQLQYQFFHILHNLLQKIEGKNVVVMVIGDHVPPLSNREKQEEYYVVNRVPWITIDLSNSIRGE